MGPSCTCFSIIWIGGLKDQDLSEAHFFRFQTDTENVQLPLREYPDNINSLAPGGEGGRKMTCFRNNRGIQETGVLWTDVMHDINWQLIDQRFWNSSAEECVWEGMCIPRTMGTSACAHFRAGLSELNCPCPLCASSSCPNLGLTEGAWVCSLSFQKEGQWIKAAGKQTRVYMRAFLIGTS